MKEIFFAISRPEMYLVVLFFVFGGFIGPDFGDFGYYFMLNECGITQM